jgi:hypothetical protein
MAIVSGDEYARRKGEKYSTNERERDMWQM